MTREGKERRTWDFEHCLWYGKGVKEKEKNNNLSKDNPLRLANPRPGTKRCHTPVRNAAQEQGVWTEKAYLFRHLCSSCTATWSRWGFQDFPKPPSVESPPSLTPLPLETVMPPALVLPLELTNPCLRTKSVSPTGSACTDRQLNSSTNEI